MRYCLKFKLDTNAAETSIDKLMVFKYFEDTNMLLPIETTYDASTNVISTHVDEVGTYCLINVEKWLGILNETPAGNYYEGGENEPANIIFCLDTRSVIDAESFNAVKNDIKTITENAFDRYSDIKVYVYYQQFGSNFKVANKLLTDSNGNNYFTGYEEAVAALDKLETNYWAYDFVEATQFMIDNCDEKIIAMYHITADDRVMGGINKAKKLTQTVQNSKYTTAEGEKIQRIYVSTLCPNDTEPFDTSSYAYELAVLSGGIAVTGYDANEDTEVMTAEVESGEFYASNTDETKTSSNVKKNLTAILGEGNNASYPVITSNGLVSVKLRKMLKRDSLTDTDEDGISDWNEVNVEIIEEISSLNSNTKTLRYDDLPTLGACLDRFSKYGYVYVEEGLNQLMSNEYMHTVLNYPILPICSDPTNPDSDGDGITDGPKLIGDAKYTDDEKPLRYSFKYYDDELQKIKLSYPNAEFVFKEYDFALTDFVEAEYESGWNLTYEEKYKAVDSEQNRLFKKHSLMYGSMFFPNIEGLSYYCDPRTYLDDTHVFAFYDLRLKENSNLVEDAKTMLKGSYFDQGEKINDYAEYFAEASKVSGLDLAFIISKCFIESAAKNQGYCSTLCAGKVATSGKSKGKVVYNMYGIGALDSAEGPVITGINQASEEGWTTERLAIVEGAKYVCETFLKNSQYTQYSQKYNIITYADSSIIGYQYATAMNYAYVGAKETKSMLCMNNIIELLFEIPIYKEVWDK